LRRLGTIFSALLAVLAAPRARAEEPVNITVQGDARPPGEIPTEPFVATSRVRRERLVAPAARASEVLRSELGVQIAEAGGLGAPATASIRGATAAQTPVYLGGVRLNDQVGGFADLSTLPLWLVDRVDVYRGNAPFEADAWGMGGAIFFEPKRPRKTEAAAGGTLGSYGTRAGFGYAAFGNDRAGALVGLSAERAANDYEFRDDRGTLFQGGDDSERRRSNADSRLRDAWLVARARPSDRARVELIVNDVAREQGVPKLALVPSRAARAELSRTLVALTARLALGESQRQLLTLRSTLLDGVSQVHDPERELGALSQETEVAGRRVEQRASLELPLGERWDLSLSTDGSVETLRRRDDAQVSAAKLAELRGAARVQWHAAEKVTVYGLAASRCRSTWPGPTSCEGAEPSGRLGVGIQERGYTVFANVGRYQREPTLGELYGAGLLVRGNRQLRPEHGVSADVGARAVWYAGPLQLSGEASAFLRTADDLVVYARTAQGYVVPLNVAQARVSGVELGTSLRAYEKVEIGCNLTLLDPRNTTPDALTRNDILPFSSRLVAAPYALISTGVLAGTLQRADLGVDLVYLSSRFADAAGLIVIPEQTTLGVTASAGFWGGILVSKLRLANVLDSQRFDIVGYPLPGRSVYGSLELHTP
jgi:iron complex outermembrane receptor protein